MPKLTLVVKLNDFSFPLAAIAHFSCCMWYLMLRTCMYLLIGTSCDHELEDTLDPQEMTGRWDTSHHCGR